MVRVTFIVKRKKLLSSYVHKQLTVASQTRPLTCCGPGSPLWVTRDVGGLEVASDPRSGTSTPADPDEWEESGVWTGRTFICKAMESHPPGSSLALTIK